MQTKADVPVVNHHPINQLLDGVSIFEQYLIHLEIYYANRIIVTSQKCAKNAIFWTYYYISFEQG